MFGNSSAHNSCGVKVVVRVRPLIRQDTDCECNILIIEEGKKCISVGKSSEQRVPKQFRFEGVFGPGVTQVRSILKALTQNIT